MQLDNDQVKFVLKDVEHVDNLDIEIIPTSTEDGISSLAFNFWSILEDYGEEITEIAMDSTCENFCQANFNGMQIYLKRKQMD